MTTDKKKFRVSYSFLNLWMSGKIDDALHVYFHKDQAVNDSIIMGRAKHKEVEEYVVKNKQLPPWLSQIKLTNPKPEYGDKGELICAYNDFMDLNARFDCLDEPNLFEYKFGNTESIDWARTFQIPFYFLICELKKIEVKKAYLIHHNPSDGTNDWIQVWNGKKKIDQARNFIDTIGNDSYLYFKNHNLIS